MNNKKRKIKKFSGIILCGILIISLMGCGSKETRKKEETTTINPEKTVAIHAGDIKVFLDEAKYYVYTAQATYETYYITEGKEIDWNSEMKDGVTWQQGVKSMVLDDICRRECMYSFAEEYNVNLSDEEKKEVGIDVENYYLKTSKILSSKIDISEKRLKYVFEKRKIADKVEEIMTASNKKLPDETYETWKTGNTVTAEEQWKTITFNKQIFTLEDIQ
ncbi:MAG: hypothetical protein ACLRZ9_11095 [Eubacterium sp.]